MDSPHEAQSIGDFYQYGADLLLEKKKSEDDAKAILQEKGLSQYDAGVIIDTLSAKIRAERKAKARKDLLYGSLWCAGGLILTFAHIGYVFWGAIVFGGYQMIRGLVRS